MDEIKIRAVRPDDKERIVKAFRGLDPRSVYLRFSVDYPYRPAMDRASSTRRSFSRSEATHE
jgi:hypothetical protein